MSCQKLRYAVRSDPGRQRPRNEDRALVGFVAPFALVCDGMGGEAGGEVASNIASEAIAAALDGAWPWTNVEDALVASIVDAGDRVRAIARAEPRLARMGTTATVAAVHGDWLLCAQVGDSRAYLYRDGHLAQLTRDQTMVELLKASGVDVVGEGIPTNVILQAVGSSVRLEVVVTRTPFRPRDVVMLCSDGLCGVVADEAMESILAANEDPDAACDALVAAANEAGGPDNITVVVLRNDAREQ
jgi:serine/threonine protein phosphatase PrpC